jgi:prepilin-type N-terminal cleavage/methylation domain-containing protein
MRNIVIGALIAAPIKCSSGATPLDGKITTGGWHRAGFTLIEALLSSVIIAVCVMAVSGAFYGGLQNVREEARTLELVNHAAGKMDELIATSFAHLQSGSDSVIVQGEAVPREWSVSLYDVDGDAVSDLDAKQVVVDVGGIEISTLLIDSVGLVTCKR